MNTDRSFCAGAHRSGESHFNEEVEAAMHTMMKYTLQTLLVLGLSNSAFIQAEETVPAPQKSVLDSLDDGKPFNASAWRKAVDTQISSLDPVKESGAIKALNDFKTVMQNNEAKENAGDHSEVRAALEVLKSKYPAQYERTLSNVHYNN